MTRWNLKWQMTLYFVLSTGAIIACIFIVWEYFESVLTSMEWWALIVGVSLLASFIAGYISARHVQRRTDRLHLAVLQVAKGNYSVRLPALDRDPFAPLFEDFNRLMENLESRLKQLQTLGEENVRLLTESNEEAVLDERRRLARDLHDTVSQQLFAIHMSASALPKIWKKHEDRADQVMAQLIQMSYAAQRQMRGLIAQLRPLELEGRTLAEALQKWFPDYCNHNNLKGVLDLQVKSELSDAFEHQLFLIIQEGMANVVKHADAEQVALTLFETAHQIVLTIQDDGVGFQQSNANQAGSYGLTTMQERARKLGGDLNVSSRKGGGCRLKISIPRFAKQAQQIELF